MNQEYNIGKFRQLSQTLNHKEINVEKSKTVYEQDTKPHPEMLYVFARKQTKYGIGMTSEKPQILLSKIESKKATFEAHELHEQYRNALSNKSSVWSDSED